MIQHVGTLMMWCFHTHSSGRVFSASFNILAGFLYAFRRIFRARRNAQGHLEPDASDEVVQASQGFGGYEMAPRVEDRKTT